MFDCKDVAVRMVYFIFRFCGVGRQMVLQPIVNFPLL